MDMDDPKKEIGRRIKKYRKARHMTQRKLAEKIGCAEITIRQYESGRYEPRLVMRRAIADALNAPYGNLFDIELIDEGKDRMKDFSGIEFASEHNGTDVFRLIELAYEQGWKDGHSEQLRKVVAELKELIREQEEDG